MRYIYQACIFPADTPYLLLFRVLRIKMQQSSQTAIKAVNAFNRDWPLFGPLRRFALCLVACALVMFSGGLTVTAQSFSDAATFPYPFNSVNHDSRPSQAVLPIATDRAVIGNRQNPDDTPAHQPTFPDDTAAFASIAVHASGHFTKRLLSVGQSASQRAAILPFAPRSPPFAA